MLIPRLNVFFRHGFNQRVENVLPHQKSNHEKENFSMKLESKFEVLD